MQSLRRRLSPLLNVLRGGRAQSFIFPGNGYQFELQHVTGCIGEGRTESAIMPLDGLCGSDAGDRRVAVTNERSMTIEESIADPIKEMDSHSKASHPPVRSLAYLLSQYPMLSMIFVLREVLQLREMGFHLDVASINMPDRAPEGLTAEELAESSQAYHLKKHALKDGLLSHLRTLFTNTPGYVRGLLLMALLGGFDPRKLLLNFMYFSEALMVGVWMRRVGQKHLHVHLGSQAATVGLYVKHVFKVGLSITVHGPDEFYDAPGMYLAEKIEAADFICCISFFARSQLMKLSPYIHWKKLVVSRLGVDPAVFSPRPARPAPAVCEILCVGRLTSAKGQHILLDAVGKLAQQGRQVRLRFVGQGPDEKSLKALAASFGKPETGGV